MQRISLLLVLLLTGLSIHAQNSAEAVAVQSDGKIVAAGTAESEGKPRFAIARYLDNGKPDTNFGLKGIATIAIGSGATLRALSIQKDGSIVVAGFANIDGVHNVALARLTADGVLDPAFGKGGIVTTGTGRIFTLLTQPDGKIIAVGSSNTKPVGGSVFLAIRYQQNGELDRTFGTGGIVRTDVGRNNNGGQAGLLQSDGKLLIVGHYAKGDLSRAVVARYLPNGSPDVSFAKQGLAILQIDGTAAAAALMADGGILVGGDSGLVDKEIFVAALDPKGAPIQPFGKAGILPLGKGSMRSLVAHPDGTFLATGLERELKEAAGAEDADENEPARWECSVITRFDPIRRQISAISFVNDQVAACGANDIAIQTDGKIIVASMGTSEQGDSFVLQRFNKDGKTDISFANAGTTEPIFKQDH